MSEEKEQYLQSILKCENVTEAYYNATNPFKTKRYSTESLLLGELADYALNKPKNVNKPNFEDLNLWNIRTLLIDEMLELSDEILKDDMNYERILSELSDVVACCTGILAKVLAQNNHEKKS